MRLSYLLFLLLLVGLTACSSTATDSDAGATVTDSLSTSDAPPPAPEGPEFPGATYQEEPILGEHLAAEQLLGTILLYEPATNTYRSNDFEWARKGFLPASTFKIPHTIIGLESGYLEDRHTLFPYAGEPRTRRVLEKEMDLLEAYRLSCLDCYQWLARQEGPELLLEWVEKLSYGAMDVNEDSYDSFWVVGESRITAFEQIAFLKALRDRDFDLKEHTWNEMRAIMVHSETEAYVIRAKTGWSIVDETEHNAWWVGYIERTVGEVIYFATNVEPGPELDPNKLGGARVRVTEAALQALGVI